MGCLPRAFPSKKPGANLNNSERLWFTTDRLPDLPVMLGLPSGTPQPVDLTENQGNSPLCWAFRKGSKLEQAGESQFRFPARAHFTASDPRSSDEWRDAQGENSPSRRMLLTCLVNPFIRSSRHCFTFRIRWAQLAARPRRNTQCFRVTESSKCSTPPRRTARTKYKTASPPATRTSPSSRNDGEWVPSRTAAGPCRNAAA